MTTIAFDTHKFIKDLTSSGMPDAQAEVLANHYVTLLTDRLATKDDIAQLAEFNQAEFASVRGDIAQLEKSTKNEIARLEKSTKNDIAQLEKSTKNDIAQLAEFNQAEFASVRSEIANLENRMDTKLDVLEERLTYRINVTVLSAQLVSVIATCTIIAFLLNLQ